MPTTNTTATPAATTRLQQQQGVVPLQQGVVPFGLPSVPYTDLALAQMTRRSSPNMLPLAGMNPFAGGAMAHPMLTRRAGKDA